MTSLAALGAYKGSDSESDDENKNCQKVTQEHLHLKKNKVTKSSVSSTPEVITKYDLNLARCVDTKNGEIVFNPTAKELYTPAQVPLKLFIKSRSVI
jgi:pre-mRNA-processing factor 17